MSTYELKKIVQYLSVLTLYSILPVQIVSDISTAVQAGAGGIFLSICSGKEYPMDKHSKNIIIFFVSMLLASLVTFSILYLLPLTESGRAPPHIA